MRYTELTFVVGYIHSSRETDITFGEVLRTAAAEDVRQIEISGLDSEEVVALLAALECWLTTQSFAAGSDPGGRSGLRNRTLVQRSSDLTLVTIGDELCGLYLSVWRIAGDAEIGVDARPKLTIARAFDELARAV